MHKEAYDFVVEALGDILPVESCVEFGGQDVNETNLGMLVRDLVKPCDYLSVDIFPGSGVDVVADAADWRTDDKYDLVVCCETLEHTPRGKEMIESALLALRPGGWLILTCATDQRPIHGAATDLPLAGEYYGNVSEDDARDWLSDWTNVSIRTRHTVDLYVKAQKPQ